VKLATPEDAGPRPEGCWLCSAKPDAAAGSRLRLIGANHEASSSDTCPKSGICMQVLQPSPNFSFCPHAVCVGDHAQRVIMSGPAAFLLQGMYFGRSVCPGALLID
jgi:hypothetical protein